MRISFVISEIIASSSQPFTEGSFVKDCLLKASEILIPDKKKVFEGISLSANTVASRIIELADNMQRHLLEMANSFEAFSIVLDESTYVSDTAQYAVFIRGVCSNLSIAKELLELIPLKDTTTGRDVFGGLE